MIEAAAEPTTAQYASLYAACLQAAMTRALVTVTTAGVGADPWYEHDLQRLADDYYRRALLIGTRQIKVDWLRSQGKVGNGISGIDPVDDLGFERRPTTDPVA